MYVHVHVYVYVKGTNNQNMLVILKALQSLFKTLHSEGTPVQIAADVPHEELVGPVREELQKKMIEEKEKTGHAKR